MANKYNKINVKNQDLFGKLDIIDKIDKNNQFTKQEVEILDKLSDDEDEEIRSRVAELLVFVDSKLAEKILVRLLDDKDELVRVNACDSLCNSDSLEVINLLKNKMLKDKSALVRGYAALSIADIATKINSDFHELNEFFRYVHSKEKTQWVKINFYKVLYMLGDNSYLNILISELNNRLYRNRCAAVHILSELVSNQNIKLIKTALTERLKVDTSIAVRSTIQKVINGMD